MGLLVVGSLALDTVETPFDNVTDALGGSATYISLAASYFSGPTSVTLVCFLCPLFFDLAHDCGTVVWCCLLWKYCVLVGKG